MSLKSAFNRRRGNSKFLKKRNNKFPFSFVPSTSVSLDTDVPCAKLHWKKTISNLFLTVTDLNDAVVASFSLGQFSRTRNRRVKISFDTLRSMFQGIYTVLHRYQVLEILVIMRTPIPRRFFSELKAFLSTRNVRLMGLLDCRRAGHGFVRAPKEPRR